MTDHSNFTVTGGTIVDNYGTTVLANNTTNTRTVTVPLGTRWLIYEATYINVDNVARSCSILLYNAATNLIGSIDSAAALGASTRRSVTLSGPWPLKAGDYVVFTWTAGGASAGGTANSALLALQSVE